MVVSCTFALSVSRSNECYSLEIRRGVDLGKNVLSPQSDLRKMEEELLREIQFFHHPSTQRVEKDQFCSSSPWEANT